ISPRPECVAILAWLANNEQIGENRNQRALFEERLEQNPVYRRGDFKRRLVGLDFGHQLTGGNHIALSLGPSRDENFFNRIAEFRRLNRCRHLPVAFHLLPGLAELAQGTLADAVADKVIRRHAVRLIGSHELREYPKPFDRVLRNWPVDPLLAREVLRDENLLVRG